MPRKAHGSATRGKRLYEIPSGSVNAGILHKPQAVVAVIRRDDRCLVIKRGPKAVLSEYWAPPSGRIEVGETQTAALVREIEEELGLKATAVAKVWECPTDRGDLLLHWWTADPEPGELHVNSDEVAETRWVTPDEFLDLEPTFAGDREFFARILPTLDPAEPLP